MGLFEFYDECLFFELVYLFWLLGVLIFWICDL